MFKVKFVCECCGWSEGEDHLPEVYGMCDGCADDERFEEQFEEVLLNDEVYRYDGLR